MAAELSSLELNPVECIIVYDELRGVSLLNKACSVLTLRCVTGIQANKDRDENMVKGSIGLVTALNPILGCEGGMQRTSSGRLSSGGYVHFHCAQFPLDIF